jgi:hypothetical protein
MQTAKTTGMRRRNNNRITRYPYCLPGRVGTSYGQPVHISFYLDSIQEAFGKRDLKKVYELFNPQS